MTLLAIVACSWERNGTRIVLSNANEPSCLIRYINAAYSVCQPAPSAASLDMVVCKGPDALRLNKQIPTRVYTPTALHHQPYTTRFYDHGLPTQRRNTHPYNGSLREDSTRVSERRGAHSPSAFSEDDPAWQRPTRAEQVITTRLVSLSLKSEF